MSSTAESSTAAFFAKKKKKKAFKGFNANKIDAATVTTTVHVDAPKVSTGGELSSALASATITESSNVVDATPLTANETDTNAAGGGEQWDDEALAAKISRKTAPTANAPAELLDMKALDSKRREQDDIAERMRVEETKAALAAAKEGMEREAERLKEEAEFKQVPDTKKVAPRFAAAADGGRWLPPHMRSGGGGASISMRSRMAGSGFQKLDTKDENLFPDLAAADAILEQQNKQGPAYKVPKKTPVGGGASWASASRPKVKVSAPSKPPAEAVPEDKPKEEPKPAAVAAPKPTPTPAASLASKPAAGSIKPKPKKKKKDLSTFKPSSS